MKIERFINRQCIDLGVSFSWNVDLAIEIAFIIWNIEIIFCKTPKFLKNVRTRK